MPKLWPVLAQGFTGLFTRLGIQAQPAGNQWFLSDTIVPMSLVDSDISLSVQAVQTWSTLGEIVAPVANVLLADTGPLARGNHHFEVYLGIEDAVALNRLEVAHRNAANSANLFEHRVMHSLGTSALNFLVSFTRFLRQDERVRVITISNAGAGSLYFASIFHNQL